MLEFITALRTDPGKSGGTSMMPYRLVEFVFRIETAVAVTCSRNDMLIPYTYVFHIVVQPIYHKFNTGLLPLLINETHKFILDV